MSLVPADMTSADEGEAGRSRVGLEALSFLAIGGIAALSFVGLSSLVIGLGTGLPDWVASVVCYAAFVVPVYLAHRRFSFRSDAPHARALPRYVLVQASGMTLATVFSYLAYGLVSLPTVLAAVLVIGLTSGVNFALLKVWAFAGAQ